MNVLGFNRLHHQKGVYFDGHDREDVVQYRNDFLSKMNDLDEKSVACDGLPPQLGEGEKLLIRVVHDESTFYSNYDQSYYWGDDMTNVLRQKSLGSSIMVSEFIDEDIRFLRDDMDQARVVLETQKDGYFTNNLLLKQVEKTVDIFDRVHPNGSGIFLFDNAPSHKKVAEDSLNVDKMNVGSGGRQPVMRDTIWNGTVQSMVLPDGRPKGMKIVLEERGIDTYNEGRPAQGETKVIPRLSRTEKFSRGIH